MLKLLNYLKENISKYKSYKNGKENCDYKRLIEEFHRKGKKVDNLKGNFTLNEVADKYFKSIEDRIKREFIEVYKDTFNIESEEDIFNNQIFKDKIRHGGSARRSYNKHYRVKEYLYKQEYTVRTNKPKKNLTKVGVKEYWEMGQKPINEITKEEVQDTWVRIQERLDIGQKTKYSVVTLLKTIFNYAKQEGFITESVCNNISKKAITRNPHNMRQRVLNVKEFHELYECLYQRENPNAFYAGILAISTGCRAKTALSVRKKDFKLDYENGFKDYYSTIDLINIKLNRFYTLPLPVEVGRYFYYLLKDYDDEEYVIRHNNPLKRENKPQSEIAKDFKECCDRTVNASPLMKKVYKFLDEDKERLSNLKINYRENRLNTTLDMIEAKKEVIKKNEDFIAREKAKIKIGTREYLERNFSFHNLRHMVVSLTSVFNPLYASRILDHKKYGITDRYIKAEIEEMRKILSNGLQDYVIDFIKPKTEILKSKLETNFHKEKEKYEASLIQEDFSNTLAVHRMNVESFAGEENYFIIKDMNISSSKQEELFELLTDNTIEDSLREYAEEILESNEHDQDKYEKIVEVLTTDSW